MGGVTKARAASQNGMLQNVVASGRCHCSRMGDRDPGNRPEVNDRIQYAFVVPARGVVPEVRGDPGRDAQVHKASRFAGGLRVLRHELVEQADRSDIRAGPGAAARGSTKRMRARLIATGTTEVNANMRVEALRIKCVYELLFAAVLRPVQNRRRCDPRAVRPGPESRTTSGHSILWRHFILWGHAFCDVTLHSVV
jgi:hypothetical protein